MAIAYRSEAHTSYGSTPTSVTCSKPTGTVDDDIMVATLFQGRYSPVANAPTPPSGWAQISTYTIVNDVSSFYARCSVWWKRAASEGSSYTWTMGADSPSTQVVIASYSGCIASGDPVDVASANSSTVTGTVTATSVTTTVANTKLLFTGHNWDGDGTLTPPTGMTERFDGLVYLADQDIASAGATGNRTLTLTGQPFWGIFLIALKPATGTNVTASPTGNALTVSIGTVSVTAAGSASVDATGNALTVSTGNPPWPNVSASPTGNALTVSIGTATVSTPGVGGSAPAFRSFSSTIYGYVTDTIISKPTGVVDGDILIASLVMFRDGGLTATAPVVPTGWTQIGSYQILLHETSTLVSRVGIWWKRAASEPSSYTWAQWEAARTQATIQAWSGCASSGSPIDSFSEATAIGLVATGTGITTATDNEKLLFICQNFDATGTLDPPTGMTERFDDLTFLSDETIATAGLTGNRTQTLAQLYGLWTAFMVALIGGSGAPGVSASPTGNVLTTSVGTATASGATGVSASPSGNALTASIGTVTVSTPTPTPIIQYMAGGIQGGGYVVDARNRDFGLLGFYLTRSAAPQPGVTLVGVTGNALTASVGTPTLASANRVSVTGNELTAGVGGAFVPELTVPPVFRSVSSTSYQERVNFSGVAKPDFTLDGDILLASIVFAANVDPGDVVTSSGWTAVTTSTVVSTGGFFARFQVFWRRAGPTEPAIYDFNHAGLTLVTQVVIEAWSGGLRVGTPINVFSTASGTGTTSTASSVTTTATNTALVWTGHNWTAFGTATPPSGYTERFENLIATSDRDGISAGATGSVASTPNGNATGTDPWQAWLIALLPSTSSQQAAGGIGSEMTISIGTVTVSTAPGVGIALVKSAKGTSTASTTTAAFATAPAVGNLIVMGFATNDYNATPNAGWTQSGGAFDTPTSMEQHTYHGGYLWWRISDGSNSFQYTIGSPTNSAWVLAEFSGVEASPNDVSAGQKNEGGISTSYTTLPITPPIGNRLLVAGINASLNNPSLAAVTVGGWTNSFTGIDSIGTGGVGTNDLASLAYRVVTSTGATAYSTGATFTPTTSTQSQTGLIISFGKVVTAARPTGSALTASTGTVSVRTTQNLSVTGNALTASVGGFSVHAGGAASVVLGGLVGRLTASVGSVFAPLNNAWNPATLFGPGALTNTDRTLSAPASASLSRVFSTKTHLAGKYYAEVTIGGQPTGAVGFTDLTAEGAVIDLATGRVLVGSTVLTTFAPIVAGDVIGMALNVNTGHCWFRVNGGLWNNDPDQSPEFGDDPTVEFPTAATVGYRNAPGYPGFLTPYTGDNIIRETQRFEFMDFIGATIVAPNCEFYGCRFRSNWTDGWNIKVDVDVPLAATFQFCTIEPFSATIPNPAWPSAGTGINGIDGSSDPTYVPYMIPYASSYQYGILQAEGGIIVEDCDIWGFGNSICFFGVRQKTVVRCWIHDAANPGSGATLYHTDGPGHLNGSGCDNVLIRDCTIASLGNTNGIAFQVADRGYHNIIVRHNYLSGFSYLVDMCHNGPGPCTGMQFINNTFATDVAWTYGPLYDNYSGQFSAANPTNIWSGNTLRVYPGSICRAQAHPVFTAADNGKFIWPDITYHTTDWVP